MTPELTKKLICCFAVVALLFAHSIPLAAQNAQKLNQVFDDVFKKFLTLELGEIGTHGTHFMESAEFAETTLEPALNKFIANNVSSFPLSSSSVVVDFDTRGGRLVNDIGNLGPIFAETGKTLGRFKLNGGLNYNYLGLSKLRGLNTEDIRFSFTHIDADTSGILGDNPNESDVMDVYLDLNVNASITAIFATIGITDKLDFGVAIPWINISMKGNAEAIVNSFTFGAIKEANHQFGKDVLNPTLNSISTYDENKSGFGDLMLRLKYNFFEEAGLDLAALVDTRLPTGDPENYLGTGAANVRLLGILSHKINDFRWHLNLGYDYRGAEFDSDEFEFAIGLDTKVASGLTFAADILGELDLNPEDVIRFYKEGEETKTIIDHIEDENGNIGKSERIVEVSNIPNRSNDHVINAALGLRYAPHERFIGMINILIPLNDGGLRSNIVPTVGLAISLF